MLVTMLKHSEISTGCPALSNPFVSVLIRSYNRLHCVLEILEVCKAQTYNNFEVVILDQSIDDHWESHRKDIEEFDSRFRVVRSKPLGPPGARNVGVAHSKGDVILFMDDDDLPVGEDWISYHAKNYADPFCIGVSGRHIHQPNEKSRYKDAQRAYKRCLTISFFFKGRVFTGINELKKPVQWLHGNNSSIRKSYIIKLGGWYPYVVSDCEEHSPYFKFQKVKQPGEYLMFDPQPIVLRRFDIPGGVERRTISLHTLLVHRMKFYHWVISTHFPVRFYGLYPFFMISCFRLATRHFLKGSRFDDIFWIRWFGNKFGKYFYIIQELVLFPFLILKFLIKPKPEWNGQVSKT